jgi:hypothetical protein
MFILILEPHMNMTKKKNKKIKKNIGENKKEY